MTNPFITLYDYDQLHNLLNGKRVLSGTGLASTDLLAHYLHEDAGDSQNLGSNGNVTTETYEGGDGGVAATDSAFHYGTGASSATFTVVHHQHTYNGNKAVTGLYSYYDGHLFHTSDFSIDPPSGTISSSRDDSGLQTTYTFDVLGRLHVVTTPGGLATTYTYGDYSAAGNTAPFVKASTSRTTATWG